MLNLSAKAPLPSELFTEIFSHLSHIDLGKIATVSQHFNKQTKNREIYLRKNQTYFPYLFKIIADKIELNPRAIFFQELLKWRAATSDTGIDIHLLLAALEGQSFIAQAAHLSLAEQDVLKLISDAVNYARFEVEPPEGKMKHATVALIKTLQPRSFPDLNPNFCGYDNIKLQSLTNIMTYLAEKRFLNIESLKDFFRDHFIAESNDNRTIFDIIKQLSSEELVSFDQAIFKIVYMMEDVNDLLEDEHTALAKISFKEEDVKYFIEFCLSYFGDGFNTLSFGFHQSRYNGKQFIEYMCDHARDEFFREIYDKTQNEINIRRAPAITPAFQNMVKTEDKDKTEPTLALRRSPRKRK